MESGSHTYYSDLGKKGGPIGSRRRAENLSPEQRSQIARLGGLSKGNRRRIANGLPPVELPAYTRIPPKSERITAIQHNGHLIEIRRSNRDGWNRPQEIQANIS